MNAIATTNGTEVSDRVESRAAPSGALFVSPHERRDGFWASIRGHALDLADPSSGHALAPTPNDLFIVSIASDLAWTARAILRAHGLPDDVRVSATWQTQEEHGDRPSLGDINLTVTVSARAKAARAALAAALENILEARSLAEPITNISWAGGGTGT
jgi:uncharacterized OsmC-like protein